MKYPYLKPKAYILFLLICSVCIVTSAQKYEKRGDQYLKVGNYARAIKDFERELRKAPERKELHSKLAFSYLKSNVNKAAALKHTSFLLLNDTTSENLLNQAKALFYNYKFDLSINALNSIKKREKVGSDILIEVERYEKWILNAQAFVKQPSDVSFINLGPSINTKQSELNPFVTIDESMLVYSSDKRYHSYAGVNYFNVNYTKRDRNKWSKGKSIGSAINSEYDEIVAGYHPHGEKIFVFHNKRGKDQVGFSTYSKKGRFDELQDFEQLIKGKKGTYGVSQTAGSDTIFFAAENKNRDTDIYYSIKLPNGDYGESRSISDNINTKGDENFPVLSKNGKRLYFSSNGENSMGGADIFYSDYNSDLKEWGIPVNMGYPVNDLYDNYSISWVETGRYAYVSAVRPEGYGQRDIYKVVFNKIEPKPIIIKGSVVIESDYTDNDISVQVSDTTNTTIVGTYKCSGDSANFVMVLDPGSYNIHFLIDQDISYVERIDISDMLYDSHAEKRIFIIPKTEEETENIE